MKKLLTKNDIKNIVKAYSLSEAEQQELNSYAEDVNREQRECDSCSATHMALFSSLPMEFRGDWAADLREAATAVLCYLAKRIQQAKLEAGADCGTANSLNQTSADLAQLLHVSAHDVKWFFIGCWSDLRWNKVVYTAHRCGLDELEVK